MNCKQRIMACVMATVGVLLMTASKGSLLYLWELKRTAKPNQWYATLCLVLLVPDAVSVVRTLWGATLLVSGTLFHWPSLHVTLLSIFTAILESAAVTYFTLEVAASLPAYVVLPLMHVLLLMQVLLDQWKPSTTRNQTQDSSGPEVEETVERRILKSSISACGLCVFVILSALLIVFRLAAAVQSVSLVASFLALSVVWCQPVRRHTLCADSSSMATRQNIVLLTGVIRLGSTLVFGVLTTSMGSEGKELNSTLSYLWSGLQDVHKDGYLLWALVLHTTTNMAACLLTRLGTYFTATRSAIVIPTMLSTVLASALFVIQCSHVGNVHLGLASCSISSSQIAVLVVSVCLWLIPFVTVRKHYFRPSDILFRPEMETFITINYNSVCFDQNLYLSYNPLSTVFGDCLTVGAKQSRVFICTTMYREADYEMEQLLKSLSKVSQSKKLKVANIYLESHIFLDNGASEFTLKEFALQLMSLVETCLSVARAESVIHKTSCGIQIRCSLPGGMPLFLHLKDPSLVKAKKRWSQVMYMKYILDHRVKVTKGRGHTVQSDSSHHVREKVGESEEKNNEILIQIRSLLKGLKKDESTATLDIPDPTSGMDISEQSSDQGIDLGDESSTFSDSSSHKDPNLKTSQDSANGPQHNTTHNSDDSVSPIERLSGSYDSLLPSASSNMHSSDGYGDLLASASSNTQSPGSYGDLLPSQFLHSKLNPAYIPDDDEETPPKWLPEFVCKFGGASVASDPFQALVSSPSANSPTQPEVFTIAEDAPEIRSEFTSIELEKPQVNEVYDNNTYILATDADMLFDDIAVLDLVNVCNEDLRLGAACGRTYPMGKKVNPIVWYQIFEYAKDFWMIKSAQNVIGSVMCCPGCFSLYRAGAIQDVVRLYAEPTTRSGDVFTKDTGEDRWMCTLMMLRGWKLRYSTNAVNSTYCPDTVTEFIKQRRRWILSDFANSFLVFRNLPRLMRQNGCFSFMYALYLIQLFIIVVFSPGTTVVMMTVGLELLTGAPYHITTPVMAMVFVLYGLTCCVLSPQVQIRVTKLCIVFLGVGMAAVVIAAGVYVFIDMIRSIDNGGLNLIEHYLLLALTGSLVYAALIHPTECYILVYGIVFLFYFPAMYMLLPLYALCNIVDQSWGTRDNQKPKVPKLICFPRIRRKKKKKANKTPSPGSCENLAEDPDAVSEQIRALSPEEERFWHDMAASVIGKDVNLGLSSEQMANGLRLLRNKVVVVAMVSNLLWIIALSFFYLWSFHSRQLGSQISAYGIMSGVLYAFSFFVQIMGMTVYRVQDSVHRLGKLIYGANKPHYVRCADDQ